MGPNIFLETSTTRIYRQLPGEETVIGKHAFGDSSANVGFGSNRELLLGCCVAYDLAVANTFHPIPADEQVTFRSPGTKPLDTADFKKFAQLDILAVPHVEIHHVLDVRSFRVEALVSHHFLVLASFARGLIAERPFPTTKKRIDRMSLAK